jgi:deoxyribose-phosphate aldolase
MNIKHYLDSTYLKTAKQSGVSEKENNQIVNDFVREAIEEKFMLVMIRPDKIVDAKKQLVDAASKVLIGTVIGFPEGTFSIDEKISEAKTAIENGVDELDFVINFEAFKLGKIDLVKQEVLQGTKLALAHRYKTTNGFPNGATVPSVIAMLENAFPLQVKASGGIKTKEEALQMIQLGVKRIGTSAAKSISDGVLDSGNY